MRLRYDYYTVAVPSDAADSVQELADIAIEEARERTRLYCTPADWTATCIRGGMDSDSVTFRVRRRRRDAAFTLRPDRRPNP